MVVEGGHCGGCINEAAEEDAACWDRLCCKGQLPDQGEDGTFGACSRCSHRREFLKHGCQLLCRDTDCLSHCIYVDAQEGDCCGG